MDATTTGLALLRAPFPPNQISYLPKGGVKLAYVGHAALTDRLLDSDPAWTWEPLTMSDNGLPVMDEMGGMWIRLTVCGVTRLGYGHAGSKTGGDAIKEVIGDALRNAAMRFGAALDLWHKGELHADDTPIPKPDAKPVAKPVAKPDAFDAKRVANNLKTGISAGDASGAASYLAGLPAPQLDAVWLLLDEKQQDALTDAWPAEVAA